MLLASIRTRRSVWWLWRSSSLTWMTRFRCVDVSTEPVRWLEVHTSMWFPWFLPSSDCWWCLKRSWSRLMPTQLLLRRASSTKWKLPILPTNMVIRWLRNTWQSILTFMHEWLIRSDGKRLTVMICVVSTHKTLLPVVEVSVMVKLALMQASCLDVWHCWE